MLPGVVYRVINKVYGEELYESLPLIYPLANLIDLGITNYSDIHGCIYQESKYISYDNGNPVIRVPINYKSAYKKDENRLELFRGALFPLE